MASTTTNDADVPAQGTRRAAAGPQRASDTELAAARADISRAFSLLGLVSNGNPVCPECGAAEKGKVKLFSDGGWHCYKRGHHGSKNGAIDLLVERGGYSFADALALLLGRPVSAKSTFTPPKELPSLDAPDDFVATVDVEVYDALVSLADPVAAAEFYGTWHISPEAVAEVGCAVALDAKSLVAELTRRFGRDRLVACGIVKPAELVANGRDYALLSQDYCVIEPYRRPDGSFVGMQFRASHDHSARVKAYPAERAKWEAARDAHEARHGEGTFTKKAPRYLPKFLSLRGAGQDSLIGCGVWRLARLEPGQRVHIVEGPKDLLAARTLGVEAYAVSGVGDMPPAKVCRLLERHTAVIRMDGDAAGAEGAERLAEHFERHGVPWVRKELPDGFDVTDVLVSRHANAGCECPTCVSWRETR